jgi:uncharacterized protein (TIGR02588 family)
LPDKEVTERGEGRSAILSHEAGKEQEKIKDAPLWMWGIAFLGLALVLGSIVFMLYEAAAGDSSPPDVTVRVDSILPTRNGFLVKFQAVNEGGSTAEGLTVEGELRNGTESVEALRERGRAFLYIGPAAI